MKTLIIVAAMLLAGSISFGQVVQSTTTKPSSHSHSHKHRAMAKKYTCSMHPEIVRKRPGKCPKCNMKLVAVKKDKKDKVWAGPPKNPTM